MLEITASKLTDNLLFLAEDWYPRLLYKFLSFAILTNLPCFQMKKPLHMMPRMGVFCPCVVTVVEKREKKSPKLDYV